MQDAPWKMNETMLLVLFRNSAEGWVMLSGVELEALPWDRPVRAAVRPGKTEECANTPRVSLQPD